LFQNLEASSHVPGAQESQKRMEQKHYHRFILLYNQWHFLELQCCGIMQQDMLGLEKKRN